MIHRTIYVHRLMLHAVQSYLCKMLGKGYEEGSRIVFHPYLMRALGILLIPIFMSGCSAGAKESYLAKDNPIHMETSKMSKIDQYLKNQIEKARATSQNIEIPVILHFKKGADLKKLENRGFKLERVISQESGLASGTITPNSLEGLEEEETIEFLEADHQADALPE